MLICSTKYWTTEFLLLSVLKPKRLWLFECVSFLPHELRGFHDTFLSTLADQGFGVYQRMDLYLLAVWQIYRCEVKQSPCLPNTSFTAFKPLLRAQQSPLCPFSTPLKAEKGHASGGHTQPVEVRWGSCNHSYQFHLTAGR